MKLDNIILAVMATLLWLVATTAGLAIGADDVAAAVKVAAVGAVADVDKRVFAKRDLATVTTTVFPSYCFGTGAPTVTPTPTPVPTPTTSQPICQIGDGQIQAGEGAQCGGTSTVLSTLSETHPTGSFTTPTPLVNTYSASASGSTGTVLTLGSVPGMTITPGTLTVQLTGSSAPSTIVNSQSGVPGVSYSKLTNSGGSAAGSGSASTLTESFSQSTLSITNSQSTLTVPTGTKTTATATSTSSAPPKETSNAASKLSAAAGGIAGVVVGLLVALGD